MSSMFAHTLLIIVQAASAPHLPPDAAQALVTLSHSLEAEAQRRVQDMARSRQPRSTLCRSRIRS
ncbi:MAG: hypothetical protein JKP95_01045 [Oceanicaulis sp.]|nr:hypothetical protein [Oceanicaulis sp.]